MDKFSYLMTFIHSNVVSSQSAGGAPMLASLEALRGIAALMVMMCHFAPHVGGSDAAVFFYTGVSLFFVITGYVFGGYFFWGEINIGNFLIKRFFRIYPLFFVSIILYAILNYFEFHSFSFSHFLLNLVFLQNFFPYARDTYNPAYWSLPVEVGFYLLVCLTASIRVVNVYLIFFLSTIYSLSVKYLFFNGFFNEQLIITHDVIVHTNNTFFRFFEFICGAFLFGLVKRGTHKKIMPEYFLLTGVFLWVVMWCIWIFIGGEGALLARGGLYTVFSYLVPISFSLILIYFIENEGNISSEFRFFSYFMGGVSYGLYLCHTAVLRFFKFVYSDVDVFYIFIYATFLSFLFAYFLHKFVETYFIQVGRKILLLKSMYSTSG